ncbi:hypothetical protein TNCT_356961 [Trichonephila clavata]|uniref:Uncharacterized protein n=1 Tax=Trichonephila clavata TaxID=2740835 RepID=A0A8X6JG92_TRICU|nr:hypothetical protein TNCT_356961 [Trichonephila clavata]
MQRCSRMRYHEAHKMGDWKGIQKADEEELLLEGWEVTEMTKCEEVTDKGFENGMRRRVTAKQIMEVRSDRSFSQFQRRNPRRGTPTADNGQCFPTHIQS